MDIGIHLQRKDRFKKFLSKRFSLRFHMFLILTGTFLSGLLATKILLLFHVNSMLIRYPLAVIFSYLAFFGSVKLWLLYLSSSGRSRRSVSNVTERAGDFVDVPDIPFPSGLSSVKPAVSIEPFSSGGGHFGGGGASGLFDNAGDLVHQTASEAIVSVPAESAASGVADGVGSAAGEAASSIFEDAGIILIILGILLAFFFGAGAYLIYEAPAILSEAAFEFVLATTLVRGMKRMDNPDWMGSVLRTTIVPFIFVFVIALTVAAIAHSSYPQAKKLSEVIGYLLSQ